MKHYDDEFGDLYSYDEEPHWLSTGEMMSMALSSVVAWGLVIGAGCLVWAAFV